MGCCWLLVRQNLCATYARVMRELCADPWAYLFIRFPIKEKQRKTIKNKTNHKKAKTLKNKEKHIKTKPNGKKTHITNKTNKDKHRHTNKSK